MIMMDWFWWMMVFCAGFGIGLFFFGGLWLTVNQLTHTKYPEALFLFSFFGRTVVSLFGFYLLIGQQIEHALISIAGFLLARLIMVRVGDLWAMSNMPLKVMQREGLSHATES
ncbi:ATP synthase subunit I [Chloroflexi bacterium TSY]|nr:ATP synthase subunit I [Chloroflexi bacterium TSY]